MDGHEVGGVCREPLDVDDVESLSPRLHGASGPPSERRAFQRVAQTTAPANGRLDRLEGEWGLRRLAPFRRAEERDVLVSAEPLRILEVEGRNRAGAVEVSIDGCDA